MKFKRRCSDIQTLVWLKCAKTFLGPLYFVSAFLNTIASLLMLIHGYGELFEYYCKDCMHEKFKIFVNVCRM